MPGFAVVSIATGDYYQSISEITFPTIRRYAEKIGARFVAITEHKIPVTPQWEKFQLLDLLGAYDRIIYLDADVLVRKCCPNLFDIVPETHLGVFNAAPFLANCANLLQLSANEYNCRDFMWDGKYYNTGVMVLSRCHRLIFRKPEKEIGPLEPGYINMQIQRQKPLIHELDARFNRMRFFDSVTGRHRYESFIIHYSGLGPDQIFGPLARDAAEIETLPDDYKSPQHIWIKVNGGLGDQMQAEPAVRFALEHVWPKADIRISTDYPELFAHLPIPSARYDIPIWKGVRHKPMSRLTLPKEESEQWAAVSSFLCHTVDYSAIALFRGTLPDIDKTYHLKVEPGSIENVLRFAANDFSDCVILHANRHRGWENRTFPQEWWQKVSDGIVALGLTPVYVGKDITDHFVTKLVGRGRAVDLTNMLTLSELIAVISLVPILVSNGSSPIHLAGAFDNWIILIPSCEYPDHALPYRNGTKSYKTAALYKKLAIDDWATVGEVKCSIADQINGPWEDYLPEVQTVLDKIKEIKKTGSASREDWSGYARYRIFYPAYLAEFFRSC